MAEAAYSPRSETRRRPQNGKNSRDGDSRRPKREELGSAIKMTDSVSNRKAPEVKPVDPAEFPRLREEYRRNVEKLVKEAKGEIIVTSHKMPDDDAIGSALAQKRILQKLYPDKKFTVIFSENRIDAWDRFLKDPTEVTWAGDKKDSSRKGDIADYLKDNDTLLCLDGGQFMRFSSQLKDLRPKNINTAILDHHQDPLDRATVKYVEPSATSTCELLAKMYGPENLSPDVCEVLLLGILGDTKTFSFADDYTETKIIAEQLAKKCGKTFEQISGMVKRSEQENLYKKLYKSRITKLPETHILSQTYSYITPEEKKPTLPTLHDRYDHSTGRREAMFEMTQEGDTDLYWTALPDASSGEIIPSCKVSFRRSRNCNADLNAIAKHFEDGAGHAGAASGSYTLTEDQRKDILEKKAKDKNFDEIAYACTFIAENLAEAISTEYARYMLVEPREDLEVPLQEEKEVVEETRMTPEQKPDKKAEEEVRAEIQEIAKEIPPKEAPAQEKKKAKGLKARLKQLWEYLKNLFRRK